MQRADNVKRLPQLPRSEPTKAQDQYLFTKERAKVRQLAKSMEEQKKLDIERKFQEHKLELEGKARRRSSAQPDAVRCRRSLPRHCA